MQSLFEQAEKMHAILSINHPNAPTGEICMGCGWTPKETIDPHLIHSIEAVKLFARIANAFGVKLSLNTLLNSPTIEQLAVAIDTPSSNSAPHRRAH